MLLNGDTEAGVSVITVDPSRLDHGAILAQRRLPESIPATATFASLSQQLAALGASTVVDVIRALPDHMPTLMHARSAAEALDRPVTAAPATPAPASVRIATKNPVPPAQPVPGAAPDRSRAPKLTTQMERLDFSSQTAQSVYRVWQGVHQAGCFSLLCVKGGALFCRVALMPLTRL
jgi:methionyl-tRNA formyltransferase